MSDGFVTAILPYTVLAGIAASITASIALVVGPFLKARTLQSDVLPRLAMIETSIKRDASRIDARLKPASVAMEPAQAQIVVSDLYDIAHDLQDRASEVHRLIDEIGKHAQAEDVRADRGRIVDLGQSVVQTESYLAAVLNRIERRKLELAEVKSASAPSKG